MFASRAESQHEANRKTCSPNNEIHGFLAADDSAPKERQALLSFNPLIRQKDSTQAPPQSQEIDVHPSLPAVEIPIFFCSDRKAITSNKIESGRVLGPAEFGAATVRVPTQERWLDEKQNLNENLAKLGWAKNSTEPTLEPFIELRGYVAEKDTKAVLKDVHADKEFWTHLSSKVKNDKEHRVFVYVHGFASSGENALYATGVLASQLEAPVISFTWPSAGKVGANLFGSNSPRALFKRDRALIDSPEVMSDLTNLIHKIKTQLPADTKVGVIAHSLGNRLVTRYLDGDANDKLDTVNFVAPDVSAKMFLSALPDITAKSNNISVYMNRHDKVLGASSLNSLFEFNVEQKLGKANVKAPGIDFIDYEKIAMPKGIGHYVPFEHLGSLIRTKMPYTDRAQQNKYYLMRRTSIEIQK